MAERHVQAVGEARDEDVRFDPLFVLMKDGPDRQIAFERLECFFDGSVSDLKRKLMRYIRHYNKQPNQVKWRYFDPSRRITSVSTVTAH